MATAISERPPAPPNHKVKRPVPPALHTAANGAASQSSPSPSLANKRPPSGFAHPGSAGITNGVGGPGVSTPRLSNRRKDTQKAPDSAKGKNAKTGPSEGSQVDRRNAKRVVEPFGTL